MSKLLERRAVLEAEIEKINTRLDKLKGHKTLKCFCGKKHKIQDLTLLVDYWYTEPYSCTGGDYYNEGEKAFVCPDNLDVKNRLFDNDWEYKVTYDKRSEFQNNIIKQFMREYQHKFKEQIDVYDKKYKEVGITRFYNNEYLGTTEGMKKFNLSVKDRMR